ncbi:uncharacterized protein J3D65DRAFT_633314 [Phyllosticta citribraziliensis]|uniref:Uncharacterized protein n=1 Tax=Phyllosticta citribraziliensis TaxID=989973 RepID=A0ABR1LGP2_9PEZI
MAAILDTVSNAASTFKSKSMGVIDGLFPPAKRAEVLSKLQTWAAANPKLAGFLLAQLALSGFPLIMFGVFTVTVFVFSLIVALLVGVLVALLFTAFMVGVALLVVLPTTFITTLGASFVFLWGLGGYYLVKWFNQSDGPAPDGSAIGDKLNNLTGGRMSFLMDGMRGQGSNGSRNDSGDKDSKDEDSKGKDGEVFPRADDGDDQKGKNAHSSARSSASTGPRKLNREHVKNGVTRAADTEDIKQKAGSATNTVSSVKGVAGGATSLT